MATDTVQVDPFAEPSRELVAELSRAPNQKPKQTLEFFALKLPYDLQRARALGAPFVVMMELTHVYFRKKINPVPLGNQNLAAAGVNRYSKMRALADLRDAGYVSFKCDGKSRPMVTLLWLPLREHSWWENATV
jgi:hypothetical protein